MDFDLELREYNQDPTTENAVALARAVSRSSTPICSSSPNILSNKLLISDLQRDILQKALDAYARLGIGQIECLTDILMELHPTLDLDRSINDILLAAKSEIFGLRNGNMGVRNEKVSENTHVAFDLNDVVRRAIAVENNHSQYSVWRYQPFHHCRQQPLARINKIEDKIS